MANSLPRRCLFLPLRALGREGEKKVALSRGNSDNSGMMKREAHTMKAHVYFKNRHGDVKRVAEVEIPSKFDTHEALEFVYCRLQNIQGSWSFGPTFEGCLERQGLVNHDYSETVKFVGEHPERFDGRKIGERSMMMGDLVVMDGKTYEVAMFGFEEYKEAV